MVKPTQDNQIGRLHTPLGKDKLLIQRLSAYERIAEPFSFEIDAVSVGAPARMHDLLGAPLSVEFKKKSGPSKLYDRWFHGLLWEYTELEQIGFDYYYRLILRPWTTFRSLNRSNRIFQNETFRGVVEKTLSGEVFENRALETTDEFEYCVQYQESDFAFVSRLMEECGAYSYFEHESAKHNFVLMDAKSKHRDSPLPEFIVRDQREFDPKAPPLWNFAERRRVGVSEFAVDDFDFKAPSRDLRKKTSAGIKEGPPSERWRSPAGSAPFKGAKVYEHPGGQVAADSETRGARLSQRRLDAERVLMATATARSPCLAAKVGDVISAKFPGSQGVSRFLVIATHHEYEAGAYRSGGDAEDAFVDLELIPASAQFRPARVTPRPVIAGPQTAVVVGKEGEEIDTDEFGRIKVRFHWDSLTSKGAADSSCWIRVAQSVAGSGWGAFFLPRIGQEVVVSFLNGDPDRPLVTGVVYNGENRPAYKPNAEKTAQWLKTRSTKGGGGYNEIYLNDAKGAELLRVHAQKDLQTTVDKGDERRTLNSGHRTTRLKVGNDSITLDKGNMVVKISRGTQSTDAMKSIELKCGKSVVKLTPSEISISSISVKINGKAQVKTSSAVVDSSASAINTVKGGLVKIN